MERGSRSQNPDTQSPEIGQKQYESLLWDEATKIFDAIVKLQNSADLLYAELQVLRQQGSRAHNDDVFRAKEKEYWLIFEKINNLRVKENKLQSVLEKVAKGTATIEEIAEFVNIHENNTEPVISKRKRAIREEALRMAAMANSRYLADNFVTSAHKKTTTNHLTTGRHASAVKGNIRPEEAESVFTYKTTDTHGGKVSHGKRPDSYTSRAGKRVRKK